MKQLRIVVEWREIASAFKRETVAGQFLLAEHELLCDAVWEFYNRN